MAQTYRIERYDGGQYPAVHPCQTATAVTRTEARRIAARMLGHRTLRGAASWERYQGGTVYQFGPHAEDNGYDYAVIIDTRLDEAIADRSDYDVCY